MLDKAHYYHGAALASLLENQNNSVKKMGLLGYVLNDDIFVFIKYTTKARSPWRFTFDQEDVDRCIKMSVDYRYMVLGLVCGGDGVCGLEWSEAKYLLDNKPGWISAKRRHNESYAVEGSTGALRTKVPLGRWSVIVHEFIKS